MLGSYEINYDVNNRFTGYPKHKIKVRATREEIDDFVREGFLMRRNFVPQEWLLEFGAALDEVMEEEKGKPGAEVYEGNGLYYRGLLDKKATFHRMIKYEPALSIARAVLGPQVSFYLDARVALANVPDAGVAWHIHTAVIPQPLPPFFCYPHTIQGLLYLDHIDDDEGPLCVIPRSHMDNAPRRDVDGKYDTHPDEIQLKFSPGDCIMLHGNLWHRTTPTAANCGRRRLIAFGYAPCWLNNSTTLGIKPAKSVADHLRASDDEIEVLLRGRSIAHY